MQMGNKPIHILRYGTVAEKIHLEKAIAAYDYLSINGNSAAYVSNAISKFVVEKFFSNKSKGFFIDPITYAFQNKIELLYSTSKTTGEVSIKKSVQKLIDYYGFPTNKVQSNVPVIANDFSDQSIKYDFCKRILEFQYELVYKHIEDNSLGKYLEYAVPTGSADIAQFRPKFLIAPYFYLDSQDPTFEQWLNLNYEFAQLSVKISSEYFNNKEIFAQIVVSKESITDSSYIKKIINLYNKLDCAGFTLWIDGLNEQEATKDELYAYTDLLNGLKGKPVYNMYGGYFSILLSHKSVGLLSGVSHGLEYGESRKVYPIGGGIPVSKYYYFPIHQRIDFTKAFYLLEHYGAINTSLENWGSPDKYYSDICGCNQCHKILGSDMINFVEFESKDFYEIHRKDQIMRRKKASSDTKENCLYHYLLCKKMEFSRLNKPITDLMTDLKRQKEVYESCDAITDGELEYLDNWADVIQGK